MPVFTAWLFGLVFGVGLIIAGMVNPAKVLGFLDLTGLWDPSLMLVMIGAISVGLLAFVWSKHRQQSLLGLKLSLPTSTRIDKRLVLGNLTFGAGWGLAGYCPGPALVSLGAWGSPAFTSTLVFVAAMLAGMGLFEILQRKAA
jgi:uncharacterized protein